jgi:hypothetical protein
VESHIESTPTIMLSITGTVSKDGSRSRREYQLVPNAARHLIQPVDVAPDQSGLVALSAERTSQPSLPAEQDVYPVLVRLISVPPSFHASDDSASHHG